MEKLNKHTEEEKLIVLAKLNRKNFRALYEKYFDVIFHFVYHRTGLEDLSADITQQVFMSAMINLPKYEFKGFPFSSWLYRIALNEVNQYYRKNKNKRYVEINEEELGELSAEILDNENEEIFSGEIVKELLNLLDPEELILVEMKYLEGKSYKEIADILLLTEVNAKVKTHRVVKKMREAFNKLNNDK